MNGKGKRGKTRPFNLIERHLHHGQNKNIVTKRHAAAIRDPPMSCIFLWSIRLPQVHAGMFRIWGLFLTAFKISKHPIAASPES